MTFLFPLIPHSTCDFLAEYWVFNAWVYILFLIFISSRNHAELSVVHANMTVLAHEVVGLMQMKATFGN